MHLFYQGAHKYASLYDFIDDTLAASDAAITEHQTEEYIQCQERNTLRESLKSESIEITNEDIYCYQNGKLMKLAENAVCVYIKMHTTLS